MVIKNNLEALNSFHYLEKNRSDLAKSLEKLSSGLSIKRAADDAAGLGISEKMRAQIMGLQTALANSKNGISLVQVAEGALSEVHSMLNRMKELTVQAQNGVYLDAPDREKLQDEMTQLCEEIDRIAQSTKFHGIHLFQNVGYNVEKLENTYWGIPFPPGSCPDLVEVEDERDVALEASPPDCPYVSKSQTQALLEKISSETQPGDLNIVYRAMAYDFDAYPVPGTDDRTDSSFDGITDASGNNIKIILQEQIVPNTVQNILARFPALGYLKNSSIGIGLRLYSNAADTTIASVTSSVGAFDSIRDFQEFTLSVNMAHVDLTTADGRSELERAVVNEMLQAFMNEALTAGMTTPGEQFPSWFVEGMAAAAGGAGDWVSTGLGLTKGSLASLSPTNLAYQVQTALSGAHSLKNSAVNATARYGTGYLACMYLGYLANGGGSVSADGIAAGLNQILGEMIGGRDGSGGISLESVLKKYTGDPAMNLNQFEREFADDPNLPQFVKDLVMAADNGTGSVLTGNLKANDLVSDTPPSTKLHLFELNTQYETIKNIYPSNVHVSSGGTATKPGISPTPLGPYPSSLFQVNGSNADAAANCTFDETWGVLNIKSGGTFQISGGKIANPGGLADFLGRIVIADNVGNITLELDGVDIELADSVYAALDLGKGNNVTIKITGGTDNVFRGGYGGAGIQVGEGSSLTIEDDGGDGTLTAIGGDKGAGIGTGAGFEFSNDLYEVGDITILSGKITAKGGEGAAGIGVGSGKNIKIGDITVEGGTITAEGGEGAAGIGAGSGDNIEIGDIIIEDGTITAKAGLGGAGIGGGDGTGSRSNVVGDIVINGGEVKAHSQGHGAGIGGGWGGTNGDITITGGKIDASCDAHGAGIGAGCGASGPSTCGDILISGGEVNAIGGADGAGIGAAWQATCGSIIIGSDSGDPTDLGPKITATIDKPQYSSGSGIGAGNSGIVTGDIVIYQGQIKANGGVSGTGIGGAEQGKVENIYIHDGNIEAIAGTRGAGIGAGLEGEAKNIEINGGTVKVQAGDEGAGIGAAQLSKVENITINDGTVTATVYDKGAGIGAGLGGEAKDIVINGGSVEVQAGNEGAGIGAAQSSKVDNITINDGVVTATAQDKGAGIGAGLEGEAKNIEINGGRVEVQAGNGGAGIGAAQSSKVEKITINNGAVTAAVQDKGAGIGAGLEGEAKNIEINGGSVEVQAGKEGAGIGAAQSGKTQNIIINDGTVTATAYEKGVGIGAGVNGTVKSIYVHDGKVTASGGSVGAGIGAGERGLVDGNILINDGTVKATGGNAGAGIGACKDGKTGNIEIRGGEITATSGADGAGIGAGKRGETGNIFITDGSITARSLTAGTGIGAGILGKVKEITICGGVIAAQSGNDGVGIGTGLCATGGDIYLLAGIITALGGMPNDIYNIGSFKDEEHEEAAKLVIGRGVTIMGGWHGEGRYNTTGAVDRVDPSKQVFAFPIPRNGKKIVSIFSEGAESGERFQWQDLNHYYPCGEQDKKNAAYIWMYGENQTLDINYADGTSERLELYFDEAPGIWRKVERTKQPDCGGIILQVGAERGQILVVPRFYFSAAALKLWKFDISTQQKADETMSYIGAAIGRVSEMRGYYGALQNRLEHIVNNLSNTTENLTAAKSRIRDADIAQEMHGLARANVMDQAAQAMMAHANMRPQQVLELLK